MITTPTIYTSSMGDWRRPHTLSDFDTQLKTPVVSKGDAVDKWASGPPSWIVFEIRGNFCSSQVRKPVHAYCTLKVVNLIPSNKCHLPLTSSSVAISLLSHSALLHSSSLSTFFFASIQYHVRGLLSDWDCMGYIHTSTRDLSHVWSRHPETSNPCSFHSP